MEETKQPQPGAEGASENKPADFQYVMQCDGPTLGTRYYGPTTAANRQDAFNVLIIQANGDGYRDSECRIV